MPDDVVYCGRSVPQITRNPDLQGAICVLPAGHPGPHHLQPMPRFEQVQHESL